MPTLLDRYRTWRAFHRRDPALALLFAEWPWADGSEARLPGLLAPCRLPAGLLEAWLAQPGSGSAEAAARAGDHAGRPRLLLLGLAGRLAAKAGDEAAARQHFEAVDREAPRERWAYLALNHLLLPGPGHVRRLAEIVERRGAESYVEIGVSRGDSLLAVKPGRIAVGIDPRPRLAAAPPPGVRVFRETSDAFFARHDLAEVLGAPGFDVAFIDGLHLSEQALRDVGNLERQSGPRSLLLLHDTLPVTPGAASRRPMGPDWSGDVWKVIACLRRFRPDLDIVTLRAPPSGLTAVSRLDRSWDWTPARLAEMQSAMAALPDAPDWPLLLRETAAVANDDASLARLAGTISR